MTNILLLDVQLSTVTLTSPSFQETFVNFLEFIRRREKLGLITGIDYSQIKKKLKTNLAHVKNLKQRFAAIFAEFLGPAAPAAQLAESLDVLKKEWLEWDSRLGSVKVDPYFTPEFLESVQRLAQVFFFIPSTNHFEAAFYELFTSEIFPDHQVHICSDPKIAGLVKTTPADHLYVLSCRPRKLKEKLLGEHKTNGQFDFGQNFIFFMSIDLDNDTLLYYDEQLALLGIIWDVCSIKLLAPKLGVITGLKEGVFKREDVILVQYFNIPGYVERGIKMDILADNFPLVFSYCHPQSKRPQRFSNVVWYINWSHLASVNDVVEIPEIRKFLGSQTFTSKPNFEVISRETVQFYCSRWLMQEKLNQIAESQELKDRLKASYPRARPMPIKSILIHDKDPKTVP